MTGKPRSKSKVSSSSQFKFSLSLTFERRMGEEGVTVSQLYNYPWGNYFWGWAGKAQGVYVTASVGPHSPETHRHFPVTRGSAAMDSFASQVRIIL